MIYLVFDPPNTPFPTHEQRVTLMGLIGKKGAKAYRESVERVLKKDNLTQLDLKTATKSQLDHLIALMSVYPDLEELWQLKQRRKSQRNLFRRLKRTNTSTS